MFDCAPHNMTSPTAPSPYVASDSGNWSGRAAWCCFNQDSGGYACFVSSATSAGWVKIDMGPGNVFLLDNYSIKGPPTGESSRAPKDWTLDGSNDDSSWDVLDTVTGESGWSADEVRNFSCDVSDTSYRYFRLNVSDNNGNSYLSFCELFYFALEPYRLSGTVKEKGVAVIRTLRCYNRSTGLLFSTDSSQADGTFSINTPDDTTEMYVVALDDDAGDQYNALIFDRVKGVAI